MMKKILTIALYLFVLGLNISAQERIKSFDLAIPVTTTATNSLYDNIEFKDNRPDNEYNSIKIDGQAFANQLSTIIKMNIDQSAGDETLYVDLENLNFYQTDNNLQSRIHIKLYEKDNSDFYLLNTLDSTISIAVPSQYQETISNIIAHFIINNLGTNSVPATSHTSYTRKNDLALYNTDIFRDGIYTNFQDFANQTPDRNEIMPKFKNDELKEIKVINKQTDKTIKIKPENIYAVVVDGQPYITNKKKYIPLYKDGNDFYFEDNNTKSRLSLSPSFSIGAGSGGYSGGGFGLNIFTRSKNEKNIFKISPINGNFIKISNN